MNTSTDGVDSRKLAEDLIKRKEDLIGLVGRTEYDKKIGEVITVLRDGMARLKAGALSTAILICTCPRPGQAPPSEMVVAWIMAAALEVIEADK